MNLVPEDHVIVIFGANGDLSRRKLLPALYHLFAEGLLPERWRLVGTSRSSLTDDEFRDFARAAVDEFCRCAATDEQWKEFAGRLSYIGHEFTAENPDPVARAVREGEAEVGGSPRRLFYLAVPPTAFGPITLALGACGLTTGARVVYEKPFGVDQASFTELNEVVHSVLDEEQIYTIDHFLGKETLQNVLALRFANGMFEPVWNRSHIDHVQVDVPEDLGVATRVGFYDRVGALRDMVVTHLFQVLSMIALEPPTSLASKPLIDEKVKVFAAMIPLGPDDVVRGQFEGYREIPDVAPGSGTETFLAARVWIDNWRWAGVPFFLRTGKRMAASRQTVTLAFREPPRRMFEMMPDDGLTIRDHVSLELGGEEGMTLSFLAKKPGPTVELERATMRFRYGGSFGSELIGAYERLVHDALIGDRALFTRADGIARTWELVEPILSVPPPLHRYPEGSWGPAASEALLAPRRWYLGNAGDEQPAVTPG